MVRALDSKSQDRFFESLASAYLRPRGNGYCREFINSNVQVPQIMVKQWHNEHKLFFGVGGWEPDGQI